MEKKYEFTGETQAWEHGTVTLRRIRALVDIPDVGVKQGDLGGWIQVERNLSQSGKAWIHDNSKVWGLAQVNDDAQVSDNACVFGNATICGNARVSSYAQVFDYACLRDSAVAACHAKVHDHACLYGCAQVMDADIRGQAVIRDQARICPHSRIGGYNKTVIKGYYTCEGETLESGTYSSEKPY